MKKYFSELQKVKLFQNLKHTLSKHYTVIILLAFLEFQNMETEKVTRGHLNGLCRCFSARLPLIVREFCVLDLEVGFQRMPFSPLVVLGGTPSSMGIKAANTEMVVFSMQSEGDGVLGSSGNLYYSYS